MPQVVTAVFDEAGITFFCALCGKYAMLTSLSLEMLSASQSHETCMRRHVPRS